MSTAFSALLAPLLTCLGKCKALALTLAFARALAFALARTLALALIRALALTAFALGALWPTAGLVSQFDVPVWPTA